MATPATTAAPAKAKRPGLSRKQIAWRAAQDIAAIATIAHDHGGLVILDAAQSLGQIPCDLPGFGADVVAAPAHKWLLGMAGAALLWVREGLEPEPLIQGGTGTTSDAVDMPVEFASRMEAGTPDVPALAALAAGAAWLDELHVDRVAAACRGAADACAAGLRALPGVRVIAADAGAPIVSFTVEGYAPAEVAALVEQVAGVQVRAGHHCAAAVHNALGTRPGGTVRASFGPFNTAADAAALVAAVATITG